MCGIIEYIGKREAAPIMVESTSNRTPSILNAMRGRLSIEEATAVLGGLDMCR